MVGGADSVATNGDGLANLGIIHDGPDRALDIASIDGCKRAAPPARPPSCAATTTTLPSTARWDC